MLQNHTKCAECIASDSKLSEHPLRAIFSPVTSIVLAEEVVEEKQNQNLWNPVVKNGEESMNKQGRDTGAAMYLCRKEILLEYVEANSGPMLSAK